MGSIRLWTRNTLITVVCCCSLAAEAWGNEAKTTREIHDALLPAETPLQAANNFIAHSSVQNKKREPLVTVRKGVINARLITPLNSSFNLTGDEVRAVVVTSLASSGRPWLQEGTILEGCVESSKKATYGQTDGSLIIRFYKANIGEKTIELSTAPDTDDGTITPGEKPRTRKQQIRGVLMTVTKLAVPAAIGTGGMSIAITTGAGAVIGATFADKGKRLKGAARGAWEGAGLNVLDPVVCKGNSVVLAEGTPIQLQLTEPVYAPKYVPKKIDVAVGEDAYGQVTQLQTHAVIRKHSEPNPEALRVVNQKISQSDLAGALSEIEIAEKLYPDDDSLKTKKEELLRLVSGNSTNASIR